MDNAGFTPASNRAPMHLPSRRELHREARRRASSPWEWFKEIALVVLLALVVSTLLRLFIVQVFYIPSPSMNPTLVENDRIAVSRLHSWTGNIKRGDVIVFDDVLGWLPPGEQPWWTKAGEFLGIIPADAGQNLVKRVVGVGGDRVQCPTMGGQLQVNGVSITEPYVMGQACTMVFDVTVPEGKLWVMGDNRANSADSRYHMSGDETPFISTDAVVGKAVAIIWPIGNWGTLPGRDAFAAVPQVQ